MDFQVDFPVSLVVSKKAITKYQILFRHLFYLKYLEKILAQTWSQAQSLRKILSSGSKESVSEEPAASISVPAFLQRAMDVLRHRLLGFVQNMGYYAFYEVVEPNWHTFEENLRTRVSAALLPR